MKPLILLLLCCLFVQLACGRDPHLEYVSKCSPFPFVLDEGFKEQFLERTGYESSLLVRKITVFTSGSRVGCWFSVGAVRLHEGQPMYDHRDFLATRENSEQGWSKMRLYTMPSQLGENLRGEVDQDTLDDLIEKWGQPVTNDMILEALIALGGE